MHHHFFPPLTVKVDMSALLPLPEGFKCKLSALLGFNARIINAWMNWWEYTINPQQKRREEIELETEYKTSTQILNYVVIAHLTNICLLVKGQSYILVSVFPVSHKNNTGYMSFPLKLSIAQLLQLFTSTNQHWLFRRQIY